MDELFPAPDETSSFRAAVAHALDCNRHNLSKVQKIVIGYLVRDFPQYIDDFHEMFIDKNSGDVFGRKRIEGKWQYMQVCYGKYFRSTVLGGAGIMELGPEDIKRLLDIELPVMNLVIGQSASKGGDA
jgi:hypothetical protein